MSWTNNARYVAYCTPMKVRPRQYGMKLVVVRPSRVTPSVGISSQRLHFAFFKPDNLVKCLHMADLLLHADDIFYCRMTNYELLR